MFCEHCRKETKFLKELKMGMICSECLNKKMSVFLVHHKQYSGYIVLPSKELAEEYITLETKDGDTQKSDLEITKEEMKIEDFYNLPEWDGW